MLWLIPANILPVESDSRADGTDAGAGRKTTFLLFCPGPRTSPCTGPGTSPCTGLCIGACTGSFEFQVDRCLV